ncbi:MAG: hypothetical protein AB8B63_23295 [Granulosicoccus sp.]
MTVSNSAIFRFARYLHKARRREKWRVGLRFLAVVLVALLALTALGAWLGVVRGFTPAIDYLVRASLVLCALACALLLLWRPLRVLRQDGGASLVESADAAFNGRVNTFLDTREDNPRQPFLQLLAHDALQIARRVPMKRIVPTSALIWPLVVVSVLLLGVAGFRHAAPQAWQNAALHVWWGWKDTGLVATREVLVNPGSIKLLAGENLELDVELAGFSTESVDLHVKEPHEEQWQTTLVSISPDGRFRFTLYRVNEAVDYYVTAAYTDSDVFNVSVVQPAKLESIDATFDYPEWTRLETIQREDVGYISAVKNTQVELIFTLDKPLNTGVLKLGDELLELIRLDASSMTVDSGAQYRASFVMLNDTQYQLLDTMLDRQIPISAEHAVTVRGDEAPEVKFLAPGRDVTASPIEEVQISVEAKDDFAVESIELLYSVNAGDWQSVLLDNQAQTNHVFYLESMGAGSETETQSGSAGVNSLEPGDLISYYVRVRDHDSASETDMMLIDVRPFERRFSEGQGAASGGGGGGAANEGSEISRRQKEIFLATWNLQKTREAAGGDTTGQEDNARLLSELQTKLAEQARTLADRSEARELVNQGEEIRQFVEYLREAAEYMQPSAVALDRLAYEEAIQPQQKALQLLQRAEALFADIRMTQQQGQGESGQQAGQDMAEMFELEMDLERNQYEQPDRGGNQAGSNQLDDIFEDLAELARRQQALAETERRRNELSREEQWQQQQLSRELEELQRQLEQLERDAAGAEGAEAEALEQAASELSERLQQARDALESAEEAREQADIESPADGTEAEEGTAEQLAGEDASTAQDGASAAQAASEALQEALRDLGETRSADLQRGLEQATRESTEILEEQRSVEQKLREAVELAARSRESGIFTSRLSREQMIELGQRKRDLQQDLESVRRDVADLEERFGSQAPETGEALEEALERLDESEAIEMLGIGSDSISSGSLATTLPSESLVTNALREWRDRLAEAGELASGEGLRATENDDIQLAEALRQLQQLRNQLTDGQQGQGEQSGDNRQAQGNEQGQNQGEQSGENQQAQGGQQGQGEQSDQNQQSQGGQQGQGQGDQSGESQQAQSGQQGQGQGQGEQSGESQQAQGGQQGQGQGQGEQSGGNQQAQGGQQGQGQSQGGGQQGEVAQRGQQGPEGQLGEPGQIQGAGINTDSRLNGGAQEGVVMDRTAREPTQTAEAIESLVPRLDALGVTEEQLEALLNSAEMLRQSGGEINAARVEAEYRQILRQVEQLEVQILNDSGSQALTQDNLARQIEVTDEAADYYRRLSEQPLRLQR